LKAINGKSENAPKHFINDISGDAQKAKQYLPSFQRAGKQLAVVDWVLSGSKFKIYVPKESCAITFTLSGVKVPGRDELFSEEALNFAREKTHQYDIEIEVESVDRGGNMVGNLFVKKKNFAIALLENGLGYVHRASIDRSLYKEEYKAAENSAKENKINIWANYTEEQDDQEEEIEDPKAEVEKDEKEKEKIKERNNRCCCYRSIRCRKFLYSNFGR